MSIRKRQFRNGPLKKSLTGGARVGRTPLLEDIDARGRPSRYGKIKVSEGLDDPVGFQQQLFQHQLEAFGSSKGSSSGSSGSNDGLFEGPRNSLPNGEPRDRRFYSRLDRAAHEESMEEGNVDEDSEPDEAAPAANLFSRGQQPPTGHPQQPLLVLLPYPLNHQEKPAVKLLSGLTPEDVLLAIPPLILFAVLTVGLFRLLQKPGDARRSRSGKEWVHSKRHRRRRRSRGHSLTCISSGEEHELSSSSCIHITPRRHQGRRKRRKQAEERSGEQLSAWLRRGAARNARAQKVPEIATPTKLESSSTNKFSSALQREYGQVLRANANALVASPVPSAELPKVLRTAQAKHIHKELKPTPSFARKTRKRQGVRGSVSLPRSTAHLDAAEKHAPLHLRAAGPPLPPSAAPVYASTSTAADVTPCPPVVAAAKTS